MQTAFLKVVCRLPADREDLLAGELTGRPVLGSLVTESGDGLIETAIYLDGGLSGDAEDLQALLTRLGAVDVRIDAEAPKDWLEAYRRRAKPFAVGRRWLIDPGGGAETPAPEGRFVLSIEPSTAFGSGSHESTQLALMALEELSVAGQSVLDVGTGSGVLALAADALGADWVMGVDIDPEAIWTARRTASVQRWAASPRYLVGTIDVIGSASFSLVMCNMVMREMRGQLGGIRDLLRPAGSLILSGLLASEKSAMGSVLNASGLSIRHEFQLSEWLALVVAHA